MRNQHNTAETSKEAYGGLIASGQISKEKEIVLQAISKIQPCTSKMLADLTGLERTNITCALNRLTYVDEAIIITSKKACPITNHKAHHYVLNNWEEIN